MNIQFIQGYSSYEYLGNSDKLHLFRVVNLQFAFVLLINTYVT